MLSNSGSVSRDSRLGHVRNVCPVLHRRVDAFHGSCDVMLMVPKQGRVGHTIHGG